jgi:hypothetical protein
VLTPIRQREPIELVADIELAQTGQGLKAMLEVLDRTKSAEDITRERNAAIQFWLDNKALAVKAVEAERDSRATVAALLFPTPTKGTQRYALAAGYSVKLVYGLDHKLGDKELVSDGVKVPIAAQVDCLLEAIEGLGNEGPAIASRIVKWTPELSVSEYEKLDLDFPLQAKIKALIDAILTVKPMSPQLSLEEPKAQKR